MEILFRVPLLAAKPVPFNPNRVKYGEFGVAIVGIAGPLTNVLLAFFGAALVQLLQGSAGIDVLTAIVIFVQINIGLFIFNMIPIPPLDGSRVLYAFAPEALQRFMVQMEQFGGERWLRAYGSFGSPNSLGIYLAVIVVLGIILYAGSDSRKIKLGITVGQLIIVSGLILSFSRGAWIAAGAGFLILGYRIWGTEQRMGFIKQIMLYLSISLFFIFTLQPLFFARFTPANRLESRSINERSSQIIEATQSIKKHPLLGVGPGAYTAALATLHPKVAAWELQPVHTIYLLFVAEWGIPASLIMGIVYLLLLKKVWRSKTPYVAVLAVLGVAGLFDHWVYSMFTGQLLWFVVWGIAVKAESGKDLIV
jgi:Zn-dependent protease